MTASEIKEIMQLFDETTITSLKLQHENFSIKLNKSVQLTSQEQNVQVAIPQNSHQVATNIIESLPPTLPAATNVKAEFITSPMVGTFYRSPSPGAAPYVSIGDTIKKGQAVGIVEAMKIMNEIEAEFDCKILEIEVNDAQPVEFGTKLVMVERI